jgi:hypothetical protein
LGRAKVTQVFQGKVWNAVQDNYKKEYPGSPFAEEMLKFRVREELSQLKPEQLTKIMEGQSYNQILSWSSCG